ncbi:hypothetical protein IGI04_027389 [Brassica rapa subsp. trilocularis]|uniref:FAD-binding PCMH-type domain-containing protein n=1 Tax=Brassica rapa subsp. trilocularis TaxID=1813537 RepID=A0ABQ7KZV7_BRACM|nr:hypothetical protein IGI04_027384 [Brassica rapa subsp. trilocularis]KAG5379547.1 hypothetical protein IGI04_027389 [Brassica rapa subsp. trilocularis]
MKKLSCLILFLSLASSSLAVDPSNQPIYESFLKCFSNQTCTAPDKLCGVVLPQSSASFTPTLRAYIRNARYNTSTSPKPLIVIAARSEAHVQATVLCTKSLNFQLKTRSGGHDYDGVSYISNRPYFVLDMSYLRNITVDMADGGGSAWVGAGATLGEFVAPKTSPDLFMRLLLQPKTKNTTQTVRASPDSASFLKRKSDYVETEISKEGLGFLFTKLMETGKLGLVFNPYGGIMCQVPTTKTPFPHRKRLFKVQHSMNWKDAGIEAENSFMEKTRSFYSYMAPFVTKNPRHTYLNYRDLEIGTNSHGPNSYREAEVYGRKYFGENFDRLVKVKTAVDPENFFRDEQSVPTLPTKPSMR